MMTPKQKTKQRALLTDAHHDYQKGLNSHAFFKTNSHEMGEDLVQDTFIKTWKYLVKGGKIDKMKAFLYHILNNLIVDEYRKKKYLTTSLDALLEKGFEPEVRDSEQMIDFLDGKGAMIMIARLPFAYQKIMRMRFVQDLTLSEMSLITGDSKNTLAVQLSRGLKKLRLIYRSE